MDWNWSSVFYFVCHVAFLRAEVQERYVIHSDRALVNAITTKKVPSKIACCVECTNHEGCVAAAFEQDTGTCVIGDRNPGVDPSEMTTAEGSTVFQEPTCEQGWVARGDFCYLLVSTPSDFATSKQHCLSLGANLLYIESLEEQAFVADTVQEGVSVWIGLEDIAVNPDVWTNGENVQFTHWAPEEPNFDGGVNVSSCVEIMSVGLWNDIPCYFDTPSVCKKNLEH